MEILTNTNLSQFLPVASEQEQIFVHEHDLYFYQVQSDARSHTLRKYVVSISLLGCTMHGFILRTSIMCVARYELSSIHQYHAVLLANSSVCYYFCCGSCANI